MSLLFYRTRMEYGFIFIKLTDAALPLFSRDQARYWAVFPSMLPTFVYFRHLHRRLDYTHLRIPVFRQTDQQRWNEHTSHKDDCGRHRPDVNCPGYPGKGLGIHVVNCWFCFPHRYSLLQLQKFVRSAMSCRNLHLQRQRLDSAIPAKRLVQKAAFGAALTLYANAISPEFSLIALILALLLGKTVAVGTDQRSPKSKDSLL